MNPELIKEYRQYIWGVFKTDIRDNPDKNLVYLSGKLITEIHELKTVILSQGDLDEKEVIKEIGDVFWYLYQFLNIYKIEWYKEDISQPKIYYGALIENLDEMENLSVKLLDNILKGQFHQKSIPAMTNENLIDQLINQLLYLCSNLEVSPAEVIKNNITKLKERHGETYNSTYYKSV